MQLSVPDTQAPDGLHASPVQMRTMTVDGLHAAFEQGKEIEKYDVCLSISSFDHDGLGRYGDPLDPSGDLRTPHDP